MLHAFITYELGFKGLVGYYFQNIPLPVSLALILVYVFVPYLLGSLNTAMIVSRIMYNDDIRRHGSSNAGFTNVMRTYGKRAAVFTLLGDILKTIVSIMIGWCVFGYLTAFIAGFCCFIGHIFPVYYGFRGGKGVLCFISMLIMLDWRVFLVLLLVFACALLTSKYISLGSVMCALLYPIITNRLNSIFLSRYASAPLGELPGVLFFTEIITILTAVTIVVKHRANIKRIMDGTESKFKIKKSKSVDSSDSEE